MVELVWDADRLGTGTSTTGSRLTTGDTAAWPPDELLAIAAAGCLMRAFLREAAQADLAILGFLAAGRFDESGGPLALHTCVVVTPDTDRQAVHAAIERARQQAPVLALLGASVTIDADVRAAGAA